ncbi:ABC-2 type transport system permease protein [Granulicatella balaenopterae]|uniref:ABC-2 type transport system permease protein n=1 Tax=Granulicatella balaenopterae TaxID=137733 RepID=A0A1H9HFN3_9LACT|nr:ABC transporter permease [Granulicatella balaenopterae]SEQ61072.1 ABC-2 type transport system permease protein [Granulicatella balaenopterae]
MIQSFKYTFKNLKNTKGFLSSMLIMPILMVILVTLTLSYSNTPVVGLVKDDPATNFSLATVRTQELEADQADYFLASLEGTLVVYVASDGSVKNYYSSVKNNPLISQVENDYKSSGEVFKEAPSIAYSIGIIIFKLITAGGLLATIVIQEKNNKIFVRLRNAKLGIFEHVLGKLLAIFLVYQVANGLIIAFYYLAGFSFGQSNVWDVFLVFTLALVLSFGLYTFVASLLDNEGYIWVISTGILFPLALFSGVLFPIATMPEWMKLIAHISPQYYLSDMLITGEVSLVSCGIMLVVATVLFVLGVKQLEKVA